MSTVSNFNRREFLGSSAAGAARVAAGVVTLGMGSVSASTLQSLRVGVIGLGQQGLELAELFASLSDARVVALCDVDVNVLGRALEKLDQSSSGRRPDVTSHYETLLDRADIDAVVIATPDHWHARMAVDACAVGKDLYIEQPLTLSPMDGAAVQQAVTRSGRVVQCGLPQRSGEHFRSAVELIRSGELGTVQLAKAWAVHKRRSIASCATSAPPPGVDYDRWLGPAQKRPFQANRFHNSWPWFWDYGAGELGLWGVQLLDVVRWGLDLELPARVAASGGKRFFRDDRETPDMLAVQYDFGDVTVLWEHRQWSRHGVEGRTAAAAFYGDKGTLIVDRSGWKVYDSPQPIYAEASEIRRAHVRDFVDAVWTRRVPSAPIAEGLLSSSLCHIGNAAWRLGQEIRLPAACNPAMLAEQPQLASLFSQPRSPWQLSDT